MTYACSDASAPVLMLPTKESVLTHDFPAVEYLSKANSSWMGLSAKLSHCSHTDSHIRIGK